MPVAEKNLSVKANLACKCQFEAASGYSCNSVFGRCAIKRHMAGALVSDW
jgi:hypothetical protein